MFVLIECNPDRLSILQELAGRVYGTRVVCTSPDLATLPERIEDAVIVGAKNRAAVGRSGMAPLAGFDLADWLDVAEELDGVPGALVPPNDADATPLVVQP
jgi:hypothetical protein